MNKEDIKFVEKDDFLFLEKPIEMKFMEIDTLLPGCNAVAEKIIRDEETCYKVIAYAKHKKDNTRFNKYVAEHYSDAKYVLIFATVEGDCLGVRLFDFYEKFSGLHKTIWKRTTEARGRCLCGVKLLADEYCNKFFDGI